MGFPAFVNKKCSISVIEHMLIYVRIVKTESTVLCDRQFLDYRPLFKLFRE